MELGKGFGTCYVETKKSHTCNYLVVKSWESMRNEFHRISNFMETFGTVPHQILPKAHFFYI